MREMSHRLVIFLSGTIKKKMLENNAISVDPNATNSPLTSQGRPVRDLGSRSPTARRPKKTHPHDV